MEQQTWKFTFLDCVYCDFANLACLLRVKIQFLQFKKEELINFEDKNKNALRELMSIIKGFGKSIKNSTYVKVCLRTKLNKETDNYISIKPGQFHSILLVISKYIHTTLLVVSQHSTQQTFKSIDSLVCPINSTSASTPIAVYS